MVFTVSSSVLGLNVQSAVYATVQAILHIVIDCAAEVMLVLCVVTVIV